ncbi:hypothetical protein [Geomonas ferrireducens]|uniref:hypothetical protein n=1 Tax=Geomonas ferrireducens TaxID=2570227 RepID=UPI0010A904EE|nr:hypothetical protein [Geomonas ferrireducens]
MDIKCLDLASAVTAATGINADLNSPSQDGTTCFSFPNLPEVAHTVALYYTGELFLNAKKLLRVRGDLYRQLKRRGNYERR